MDGISSLDAVMGWSLFFLKCTGMLLYFLLNF